MYRLKLFVGTESLRDLGLKYLKNMKKYILATIIFILFINVVSCQTTKQKIRIEEIKYLNDNGLLSITFDIVNLSKDTLYLNYKALIIKIIKKNKIIKWEYPKVDVQPFIKPVLKNNEQIYDKRDILNKEDPTEKLVTSFANKLFIKNEKINHKLSKYTDRIIQNIIDNCIVLLPLETYKHETYLFSKKIDKTCRVSVKYSDSKIFTYFVDDNGKRIEINN